MQIFINDEMEQTSINLQSLTKRVRARPFPDDVPNSAELHTILNLADNLSFNVNCSFDTARNSKLVNNG